jgi:hypothetical protein
MKKDIIGIIACCLLLAANQTQATVVTYTIEDIGTFANYTTLNSGQTYSGTGFVGLYETALNGSDMFGHLFGLEDVNFSRTALEVDVSGLAGATINSARLDFTLQNGASASQSVTATSFTANGNLGWFWTPPDTLGSATHTVVGQSPNSLDVTSLLAAQVAANATWFGLHLSGTSAYQWTYTWPGLGYDPDSANVRLVVDYSAVPEPSTFVVGALLLLPFALRSARRLFGQFPA